MARAVEVNIGLAHNPGCTCQHLDPITVTAQPVIISEGCPTSHEPRTQGYVVSGGHASEPTLAGRLVITWPAANGAPALPNWGVTLHDADTGEQILTGFKLSLTLGTDTGYEQGAIEADITALADEDGTILKGGAHPVMTDEYREHRDCIERHRLNGPLADEEAGRLDALDRKFPGPQFRTGVFRYVVAEMCVAETEGNGD